MSDIRTKACFPRVERVPRGENIVTYEINSSDICMDYSREDLEIPYLDNVMDEAMRCNGGLEKVILVSESEPVAVKCAAFLLENEPLILANRKCDELEKDADDPYGIYDDFQYEYEPNDYNLKLVHMPEGQTIKEAPVNMCLKLLEEVDAEAVIYEGISTDEETTEKMEAVLVDDRKRKYIWIRSKQLMDSWVNTLRTDYGYSVLIIKDVPNIYYEKIFSMLMKELRYELEDDIAVWDIVNRIIQQFGKDFSEEKIEWMIKQAIHENKQRGGNGLLSRDDFSLIQFSGKNAFDKLDEMPGLCEMKEVILEQTALRKETRRNPMLKDKHNHMIFYGNPGTGKTTCARLMAEIMADNGVKNMVFVEATRSDIIGQYVGHTAKKIADLFEKARGGILFVDESGFFLNTGAGGYVTEAIKEFVRYMENYPDVMVIFAMYEKEAEGFLRLDEGLASRISRMVDFRDYTHAELLDIFKYMVKENGYQIGDEAINAFGEYIDIRRQDKNFGNARDVRKVFESAVVQHSVRIMNSKDEFDCLTLEDIKNGIAKLRKTPKYKKDFGFKYSSYTTGNLAVNI